MQIVELTSSLLVHYVYKLQLCCFPVSNIFELDDGKKKNNLGPIVMENVAQYKHTTTTTTKPVSPKQVGVG